MRHQNIGPHNDSFFIHLPSNTIGDGKNTTGTFRVDLPYQLDLQGEWLVGLSSIIFCKSWPNLGPEQKPGDNSMVFEHKPTKELVVVRPPSRNYETIQMLLHALNKGIRQRGKELNPRLSLTASATVCSKVGDSGGLPPVHQTMTKDDEDDPTNPLMDAVLLYYDDTLQRVVLKLNEKRIVNSVHFGPLLQYILGFSTKMDLSSLTQRKNTAEYPPDLNAGVYSLHVYCDIIHPQLIGDKVAHLLKVVPIRNDTKFGGVVYEAFNPIAFLPVVTRNIKTINVQIRGDSGQKLDFQFGKTILCLAFIRKPHRMLP